MKVTTGFGYYVQNNKIIGKYQFPIGSHPDLPSGMTFVEVANQAALDAIQVYVAPIAPAQAFNVNIFCESLFANFSGDSNLFPYYAVLKDLASFQNFYGMNLIVNALLSASILTSQEVTTLNTILASQNIVLSTFTSPS